MCGTTLNDSKPIAKKEHKCDWCGEMILVGEKYSKWTGIFQSDFGTTKLHLVCLKAQDESDFSCDEGFEKYSNKKGKTEYESQEEEQNV